jgi:hypothetical protein
VTLCLNFQPEITIEDAGAMAFSKMLEFLYRCFQSVFPVAKILTPPSGSYDSEADDGQLVLQVLSLSDRYMLQGLKRQCEAALHCRLDEVSLSSSQKAHFTCNRTLSVLCGINAARSRCLQRCIFASSLCFLHR